MSSYTVVGAGAIGGTLAWYLVRAGHDVRLVDADPAHVEAVQENGLVLERNGVREAVEVPVSDLETDLSRGTVLLAVKALATASASSWIAERLHPDDCVVSLQNGLNEAVIARAVGAERTVGAFVNLFADVVESGVVRDGGAGALRIGELDGSTSTRVETVVADLQAWGPAEATSNVVGYLWSKLAFGAVLTATALADAPMADLIEAHPAAVAGLVREVVGLAGLQGIAVEGFDAFDPHGTLSDDPAPALAGLVAWLRTQSKDRSGIWRDIAVRRRPTEVPVHYRPVLAMAAERGVAAPLLASVVAQIAEVESDPTSMSVARLDTLETFALTTAATQEVAP
ncbi:ketopantoate reductase family protein [Kineococcus sp. SYSU DK003]|uniref:ketopantoate reductase family protein n=1 Tax=Kineococcus sp. SYSU DK003 TaxID=3383124 RepID=UPI003D7D1BFE